MFKEITSRPRKAKRRGFTIIELLIVIGVIGILAGMMFPAIQLVRQHALKARTKALIGNISVAIKAYESDWGAWPQVAGLSQCTDDVPDAAARLVASKALFFCLCNAFQAGTSITTPTGATSGSINPSMTAGPYLELSEKDYDMAGPERNIIDAWGNNLAYSADIDYNPGSVPPNHNTSSFDLWSPGRDGMTSSAAQKEDDVTNW